MGEKTNLNYLLGMSILWVVLLSSLIAGKTIYVDDDANGLNDGTSWQNAYNYLQDAIEDANSSAKPVEIRVAQGIYRPDQTSADPNGTGDREATFQLINGVIIKGGYAGYGEPDPNVRNIDAYKTILSGDLDGNDVDVNDPFDLLRKPSRGENSYHVVTGSETNATALLDGFTITGGNATASFEGPSGRGGGMYNDSGSPTVINCIFSKNCAWNGGCVYNYYGNPSFVNCVFSKSFADGGGAMHNSYSSPTLTNCTFSENSLSHTMSDLGGGGMLNWGSSPTIIDCTFSKNRTGSWGGGMYNLGSSTTLVHCTFTENSGGFGGGICNQYSSAKLTDCTFGKNRTGIYNSGGGIYNDDKSILTLSNCIFIQNSAADGGGIYNTRSNITVSNCSFTGNSAYASGNESGYGGGMWNNGIEATIVSCTFSQNFAERSGGGIYTIGKSMVTNYCIFSGNSAMEYGGGICCQGGRLTLANCTFAGNSAQNGKALACYAVMFGPEVQGNNCILWDGGDEIFKQLGSKFDITYSDIQGGLPGEGNIDKDPCFAKPGYWDPNETPQDPNDDFWVDGDYHLKSQAGRWNTNEGRGTKDEVTSPCIDTGDPHSPIGLEPFPNGGIINIGAYGGTEEASKSYFGEPVCETIIAGDINGDCIVNLKDFALIAFHWLEEH